MQDPKPIMRSPRNRVRASLSTGVLFILWVSGCGGSNPSSSSSTSTAAVDPQKYFAPAVAGGTAPSTYTFDDVLSTYSHTAYGVPNLSGSQILSAGTFNVAQRGLRDLSISTAYVSNGAIPPIYLPSAPSVEGGSFALELAGQAGGLAQILEVPPTTQQLVQQPAVPFVAANQCPNLSSTQTYQFITIPGPFLTFGTAPGDLGWDPAAETAFGSVDISTTGSTVNFQNIRQFTLPSTGGSGMPAQPPPSSLTGICAPTYFGSTITLPGQATVTDPGVSAGTSPVSPQAIIGIGPSGLLVEDNGYNVNLALTNPPPPLPYENALGAGTGAVGLPVPSTGVDTGAVVGAQYLGFIYAAGQATGSISWSSHLASFGFSAVPSSCASVTASTSTLVYGGDFPQSNGQDNPAASPDGFGNCDFAIDLGSQDSVNNGRFPNATIWVGAGYAANTTGASYSFPAVAIAGQLNGKYAIFLIGEDSSQPWAIYLLQSN